VRERTIRTVVILSIVSAQLPRRRPIAPRWEIGTCVWVVEREQSPLRAAAGSAAAIEVGRGGGADEDEGGGGGGGGGGDWVLTADPVGGAAAGSELKASYGIHSNAHNLLNYGFCLEVFFLFFLFVFFAAAVSVAAASKREEEVRSRAPFVVLFSRRSSPPSTVRRGPVPRFVFSRDRERPPRSAARPPHAFSRSPVAVIRDAAARCVFGITPSTTGAPTAAAQRRSATERGR